MITAFGETHKGMVRPSNQDSFAIKILEDGAVLAVVCDGMGGQAGGNIASRNAVNIITQHVSCNYRPNYDSNSIRNTMLSAVAAANALVFDMAKKKEELAGMGTTVVACLVKNGCAHILHAGDSRAYLAGGETISPLTRDHSVVQMMVDKGEITLEEARDHPQKHFITRALGVAPGLDTDYAERNLTAGQTILICTDGLTNHLVDADLLQIIQSCEPNMVPQRLINKANDHGGKDNITAVVLCAR